MITCTIDGKHVQLAQDTTKTKSSMRTLPLVPVFKEKLLKLQEEQKEYRRVCGKCYDKRYTDYICVDEMGTLISRHGRKFCVSDIRQSQEWRCKNRAEFGLYPLITGVPGTQGGMRAQRECRPALTGKLPQRDQPAALSANMS